MGRGGRAGARLRRAAQSALAGPQTDWLELSPANPYLNLKSGPDHTLANQAIMLHASTPKRVQLLDI